MIGIEIEGGTILITMTGIVSDADWDAAVSVLEDKLFLQTSKSVERACEQAFPYRPGEGRSGSRRSPGATS